MPQKKDRKIASLFMQCMLVGKKMTSSTYYARHKKEFMAFNRTPEQKEYMRNYMRKYLNDNPDVRERMRVCVRLHNRKPKVRARIKAYEKMHPEQKEYRRKYMRQYRKEVENGKRKPVKRIQKLK